MLAGVALVLLAPGLRGEPIPVRHQQGAAHGFLALRSLQGTRLAIGDVTQVVHGDRVTSRLTFRFRDGSIDDDLTVFSQHGVFRLISDHHVQHGPSFPKPIDVLIETVSGMITSRTDDGRVNREKLVLPADLANGLPPNLLMNISPSVPETKLSFVAPGAKPRLIQVSVKPAGKVGFSVGGSPRKATDYVLHVDIGGVAGMVAPLIGKQPPDYHIWIMTGSTPAFIRAEGALYEGGPVWRIEQISPSFAQ
ncbi:MAG: hypothetical protein H0X25_04860 [Acidobacteriales bacterium]|nr:hypothetical protein [Terriglobales bacterium]